MYNTVSKIDTINKIWGTICKIKGPINTIIGKIKMTEGRIIGSISNLKATV